MTLVLRYSARSDRGLVRQNNQDAVYAGPRLLALADGMGGHAAGEVASSLVISALAPLDEDDPSDDLLAELRDATVQGNAAITRHVADAPDLEGMGTTLTAILFAGSRLGLVHIGDSRAYQLRDGFLTQITKDDTFVQSLIDEGRITEEEAHTHPQRSLLLRAITGQDVDPSLTIREARAGDRYLLCSDGLSGVVSDETLAETLRAYPDPRECADRMIELALRGGGPDNITCIVADVVDIDFGEDDPIVGGSMGGVEDRPPPDSAAARASATTLTRTAPQRVVPAVEAPPARRRVRPRVVIAVLVVLALLVGGGLLARMWVMQQYFVGADGEDVAIFQGVRGDVLGVPLNSVAERTDIALADLPETERSQVRDGIITDNGLTGARGLVERLRDRMLEPCPLPQPEPQPQLPPQPEQQAQPEQQPQPGQQPPPGQQPQPEQQPQPGQQPPPGQQPQPGQQPPGVDPGLAVPGLPPVDSTPLLTPAPEPGTTCRSVS
jgi:serine/threonine protein phosphatase PrpC